MRAAFVELIRSQCLARALSGRSGSEQSRLSNPPRIRLQRVSRSYPSRPAVQLLPGARPDQRPAPLASAMPERLVRQCFDRRRPAPDSCTTQLRDQHLHGRRSHAFSRRAGRADLPRRVPAWSGSDAALGHVSQARTRSTPSPRRTLSFCTSASRSPKPAREASMRRSIATPSRAISTPAGASPAAIDDRG